jgi:hypothetical protein
MYIMPNVALKVHLFKNRFLKFVENILRFGDAQWAEKQNIVGSHWEPFWRFCSVCHPQLMPDFVLKFENLRHDLKRWNFQTIS